MAHGKMGPCHGEHPAGSRERPTGTVATEPKCQSRQVEWAAGRARVSQVTDYVPNSQNIQFQQSTALISLRLEKYMKGHSWLESSYTNATIGSQSQHDDPLRTV